MTKPDVQLAPAKFGGCPTPFTTQAKCEKRILRYLYEGAMFMHVVDVSTTQTRSCAVRLGLTVDTMGASCSTRESKRSAWPSNATKTKLSLDDRIAIVGAGAAGLHVAAQLKHRGFTDIVVFEKEFRVAGKIETMELNGSVHETGACWLSPNYTYVRELVHKYPVDGQVEKKAGAKGTRDVVLGRTEDGVQFVDFSSWIAAEVEKQVLPEALHAFVPQKLQTINVYLAMRRYIARHKELNGEYTNTVIPEPTEDEVMAELAKPFRQFLVDNDLEALLPFMSVVQVAQGYGFLENVPAFYALMWCEPMLVDGYIQSRLPGGPPIPTLLTKGYEPIFKQMVVQEKLTDHIKLGAVVTKIDRKGPKEAPVRIHYRQRKAESKEEADETDEKEMVHDCDFVMLAASIPELIKNGILDANEDEREVFGALRPLTIVSHVVHAVDPDIDKHQPVMTNPVGVSLQGQGHVYTIRNSGTSITDKPHVGPNGKSTFLTYQLWDEAKVLDAAGRKEFTDIMLDDMQNSYGMKDVEAERQRAFHYFYHFDVEGIKKRYPWKILRMQGHNRCWYLGASAVFESVNNIVAFNELMLSDALTVVDPDDPLTGCLPL